MEHRLNVAFVSDIVCPWCALGFTKLMLAVDKMSPNIAVTVECLPYELNPGLGAEGILLSDHLAEIMNAGAEQIAQVQQRMTQMGADTGFTFNFSPTSRIYNTNKAHQLLLLAAESGQQLELYQALFESYFSLNKDIADSSILIAIAKQIGMDVERVRSTLATNALNEEVLAANKRVKLLGVTGVPALILDDNQVLKGAREVDDLVTLLTRYAENNLVTPL